MLNGRIWYSLSLKSSQCLWRVTSTTTHLRGCVVLRRYQTGGQEGYEKLANSLPHDPVIQYNFLRSVILEDPSFVIRRVESGKFALNTSVILLYEEALTQTGLKDKISSRSKYHFAVPSTIIKSSKWGKRLQIHLKTLSRTVSSVIKAAILLQLVVAGYMVYKWYTGDLSLGDLMSSKKYDAQIPDKSFDDVAGNSAAKKQMENLVQFLSEPEKFVSMGAKIPKGTLLSGPPGVGKTLLAKALAGEAGVPFFFASGSEFDQMFVGLGAQRMRSLFKAAKAAAPAIIFIDEIDTVGMARGYYRQTINQLLAEMDGFEENDGVVVLAATNDVEVLDAALTREGRFDNKISLTLPSSKGRLEILQVHSRNKTLADNVDLDFLAKACTGMSGAQLATVVNTAGLHAVQRGKTGIDQDDLEFARAKVLMGGIDSSLDISDEDRFKIAAHEAGHAVMELLREGITEKKIYLATIEPRGTTLGHVSSVHKEDVQSITNEQLLAIIDIGFGGRAAEEVLYNEDTTKISTGCAADMSNIMRCAQILIEDNGYSAEQGLVRYSDCKTKNMETNELIQGEIKKLLDARYKKTKEELKKHKREWARLRDFLVEYRTLTGEECRTIFQGGKPSRSPFEGLPSS